VHDLANFRRVGRPVGVVQVDYTLATDVFVLPSDNTDPGVPLRLYTPRTMEQWLAGHESFANADLTTDVVGAIRCTCVPPDRRSSLEAFVGNNIRDVSGPVGALLVIGLTLVALFKAKKFGELDLHDQQVLTDDADAYLRSRGR
jgi:hypothetical protein